MKSCRPENKSSIPETSGPIPFPDCAGEPTINNTSHKRSSNHPSTSIELNLTMASTTAIRRLALNASRTSRSFHSSSRSFIKVGDKIPNLDVLVENSPGNKVNLSEAIKGKALIIGVPAAFSTSNFSLMLMTNRLPLVNLYGYFCLKVPRCQ